MTDKPTPKEIDDLVYELRQTCKDDTYSLASAVLAKWGQPAVKGYPVAWLSPWRKDQVTTDYDAYGAQGIPLYAAPQPVARATAAPTHPAPSGATEEVVACGNCGGSGRMVRDPDIGTDQECFVCDGSGSFSGPATPQPTQTQQGENHDR